MVGGPGSKRSIEAWRQVYRAMDHGIVKDACKNTATMKKFPGKIQDFANAFVVMQTKRHSADYDPFGKFYKSATKNDIAGVEAAINDFVSAPILDRRAFAAWVMFKNRKP
jgi:hypothetical protein